MCNNCPFRDLDITCPAISQKHPRYCAWVDPSSTGYQPTGAQALVSIAERLANPPEVVPVSSGQPVPAPEGLTAKERARASLHNRKPCNCGKGNPKA